jgi:hypothetical protein
LEFRTAGERFEQVLALFRLLSSNVLEYLNIVGLRQWVET